MHRYLSRIVRTLILQRFLGEKRIRYLIFEDFFTFQILPILRRRYFVAIFLEKVRTILYKIRRYFSCILKANSFPPSSKILAGIKKILS